MKTRSSQEKTGTATQAPALSDGPVVSGETLAHASHELKTPITTLKLQFQLMERFLRTSPDQTRLLPRIEKLVETANQQVDRLSELVDRFLTVRPARSDALKNSAHRD